MKFRCPAKGEIRGGGHEEGKKERTKNQGQGRKNRPRRKVSEGNLATEERK